MSSTSIGSFDVVIVGAGSAGCVLANRLSADSKRRVCLLEAGGDDDWMWIHIPVGYLYTQGDPRTDWCFKTEPEPGLNGRALNYPRGKVVGGCSAINGMIYMRGQSADYDHWRQLGNPGWSWDDVLPFFKRHEDFAGGADELHATGGEWRIEPPRVSWAVLDAFRKAAAETGIPPVEDFNRGTNEGCGYFHVNQRSGVRWTTAKAFLRPVQNRPNLLVLKKAQALRLLLDGHRCTGVEFSRDGRVQRVEAAAEVVLAAGAIGSPALLQLSGIGPGDVLQAAGVPVVHELPGVGRNLQDHLQIRLVYKVKGIPTLNEQAGSLFGKAWMGLEYALFRKGPLTMAPSQLGAFARSGPDVATPDLEYHIQPLSLDRFGEPLHSFPAFTASVCNLRPTSRGTVHIKDGDATTAPGIRPNYLATDHDKAVAAAAIRLTRRICAAPALASFITEELRPGAAIASEADLVKAAGDLGTTIFHPVGTCKMGPDNDAGAVVDASLRLRGIEALRIADASIMPTITSGNTAAPTMMIAERASSLIAAA